MIINPNNPTGALYSEEILLKIIAIARRHSLLIFSDEIYDRLVFDNIQHVSTAALAPELPVITFNGLSKSHRIAGFRCGWLCISDVKNQARGYIEGLKKLASIRICSNVLAQSVIPAAFECSRASQDWLLPGGRLFEQRKYIAKALNEIPGISAVKPKAGLYIFPKIDLNKYRVEDDEQFVLNFLLRHHVPFDSRRGVLLEKPGSFPHRLSAFGGRAFFRIGQAHAVFEGL